MGFRFICEQCGSDKFHVFWDITRGNTTLESAVNLKCVKCGAEYILVPSINWDMENITNPQVQVTNDKGKLIHFPEEQEGEEQ